MGFYSAVAIATVLTLGTLSVFRWIESLLPSLIYAQCSLHLGCQPSMSEKDLRELLSNYGFDILKLSYAFAREDGKGFKYHMMIRTRKRQHFEKLSQRLYELESVLEFKISLTGD